MPTFAITEDEFTAALHTVVADRGLNWTYPDIDADPDAYIDPADQHPLLAEATGEHGVPSCRYVSADGHRPMCLIGAALHRAGIPLHVLADHEGLLADSILRLLIAPGLPDSVTDAARAAQNAQDDGRTLHDAVTAYHSVLLNARIPAPAGPRPKKALVPLDPTCTDPTRHQDTAGPSSSTGPPSSCLRPATTNDPLCGSVAP